MVHCKQQLEKWRATMMLGLAVGSWFQESLGGRVIASLPPGETCAGRSDSSENSQLSFALLAKAEIKSASFTISQVLDSYFFHSSQSP